MFEQVASWDEGLAEYVADLDPAVIDGRDAMTLLLHHVHMEKLNSAAKTVLLQRVAETRTWAHRGDRSVAHWLAREAGIGLGEAMATVDTAERLPECPATETALRAGKLSRVQVNEVTAAAVVDPASETRLLQKAQRGTSKDLKEFSARENHHITDYSLVQETRIENIVPLCSYHHDLVTYRGFTLIRGPDGLVDLIAPDQPLTAEAPDRSPSDQSCLDPSCRRCATGDARPWRRDLRRARPQLRSRRRPLRALPQGSDLDPGAVAQVLQ